MKNNVFKLITLFWGMGVITSCADQSDPTQGPPKDRKWKMVWNDEFNGSRYDTTRWFPSGGGWYLPDFKTRHSDENLIVDGKGNLIIRVSKNDDGTILFNNGLTSYFKKAYGYFEARMQFSTQPGWWAAFWLSGHPYNEGDDCFLFPQEFDIMEDIWKTTKENEIIQCYHVNAGLEQYAQVKEYGKADMINCNELRRHSLLKEFIPDIYEGWHTVGLEWTPLEHIFYVDGKENYRLNYRECPVTNVPQKIWLSGSYRTPIDSASATFGLVKYAKLPDQVIFDYVRVYDQDWGNKTTPIATAEVLSPKSTFAKDDTVRVRVNARDDDGTIKTLYLFSKGRIRAEVDVNSADAENTFTITNLLPGENTIIVMAKDNDGRVGQSSMIRVYVDK